MVTARRIRRFRLDELDANEANLPEQVALLGVARELERLAADVEVIPHTGFADRVMAAVAAEPAPRPVIAAIGAARARRPLAALAALADLWRVAWTGGRPLAVRAPAMALVSILLVGSIGLGAVGAGATLGVLGLRPGPTSLVSPAPSVLVVAPPSASADTEATPEPSLEPSAEPSTEPSPSDDSADASAKPTRTPAPEGGDSQTGTPRPARTPDPTHRGDHTPGASHSPRPSHSPWPTQSDGHNHSPSPRPTPSPTGSD